MRVVIDADRCQGHGRCFTLAPSLFDYDEMGNGVVRGDGAVRGDSLELARLAAANCPEHAITLQEVG